MIKKDCAYYFSSEGFGESIIFFVPLLGPPLDGFDHPVPRDVQELHGIG